MLLPFYSSIRERQDQLGSLGMHPTRDDRELGMLYGCDGQATVSLAGTLQVLFAVLSREGALRMEHGAERRGGLETYLRRRAGRSMTGGSKQRSLSSSGGSRRQRLPSCLWADGMWSTTTCRLKKYEHHIEVLRKKSYGELDFP